MLRSGFIKGAFRHIAHLPKLLFIVRGWPRLLADCLGRRRQVYRLQTRWGAVCELRPNTSDWWIFLEVFVFEIYQRVRDTIRRSEVIIDVGANVGYFALYAGSLNPRAKIHAFEPFPPNAARFQHNLMLNPGNQITLYASAVAAQNGTETLFFTPGDDSGCSLNRQQGQSCTVPTVGVNDLFIVCGVNKCDLLKMDCEGSELLLLSALTPDNLAKIGSAILEYHDLAFVEPLKTIFLRAGFKCEVLPKINTLVAFR